MNQCDVCGGTVGVKNMTDVLDDHFGPSLCEACQHLSGPTDDSPRMLHFHHHAGSQDSWSIYIASIARTFAHGSLL